MFTPTNAYDIDTALGSTSMPGFSEWSLMYRRYRVRASRVKAEFMNNETASCVVGVMPISANPGANHLASTTISVISQPITRTKACGPATGAGKATVVHKMTTAQMSGAADLNIADDYSSPVGAGPILNWYWDVFAYTGGTVLTNGLLVHINVDVDVEFFDVASPVA